MEEGRVVARFAQDFRQRSQAVAGIRRGDKGLSRPSDGAEQGGHGIDRLRSAGIGLGEHIGMVEQRVDKRRVARITGDAAIQTAHPLFGHALPNDDNDVASFETCGPRAVGSGTAHGIEVLPGFFFGEIGERLHACFADCAQEGERRIEHEGLLLRFVAIECGIVRREWAQIAVSAAHRTETERAGRHDRSTSDEQSAAARHLQRTKHKKAVQCPPNECDDSEK